MVICLERGADLHMAQPMPLPLSVSCFSKIQIGFTFLVYRLTRVVPDKGPLNRCVHVCGLNDTKNHRICHSVHYLHVLYVAKVLSMFNCE